MEGMYSVVVNIRTLKGMQEIGTFFIGSDTGFAHSIFDGLVGDPTLNGEPIIRIDLVIKTGKTPPILLKSLMCTLNQYAENCKVIARDTFTFFTLENKCQP